jgi:hypothetical protein
MMLVLEFGAALSLDSAFHNMKPGGSNSYEL